MPYRLKEYRRLAEEAREEAEKKETSKEARATFQVVAKRWRELADECKRLGL